MKLKKQSRKRSVPLPRQRAKAKIRSDRSSTLRRGTSFLTARWVRNGLLLSGLILPQIILYGPSLTGSKVLLPLDLLASRGNYFPTASNAAPTPINPALADEVLLGVPTLEYAAKEVRAGRIPLWNPHNFAGAPFATFPIYSPFFLIFCGWPSPITLAYLQLMKSVIAGLGAYLFFKRALGVGFWASAVGAWCYPLTGFFVLWQGYGMTQVVAFLPWILLAVNLTVRKPKGFTPLLLVLFTALVLLVGQLDVAGLVLLSSGLYALVCLVEVHGVQKWSRRTLASVAVLVLGWGLGFCLATVYVLPLVDYARTGERFVRRAAGEEERPPVGTAALPQIVLPNVYGSTQKGSWRIVHGNQLESSAAGYAGFLAALLLAPLAFCHNDLRTRSLWWLGLVVLSLGWVLDLPGLVQLMRMPVANSFSWNRWTMLTGFALTVLAVIGLDAVMKDMAKPRLWFALPSLLAAVVCVWCLYHVVQMPQAIVDFSEKAHEAPANATLWGLSAPQVAAEVESYYRFYAGVGALLGALTVMGWGILSSGMQIRGWMLAIVVGSILTELLVYAYNVNPQCDRGMYYPPLPALEELKQRPPGRILCVLCLKPELNLMVGLPDIRGYDAVDPERLIEVLAFARDSMAPTPPPYAWTQNFVPKVSWSSGSVRVSPVLSMLNVRYLVSDHDLPDGIRTIIRRDGYVVVENERALPRTFVPQSIQQVEDGQEFIDRMGDDTFDAARVSYVIEPVGLPAACRGTTRIVQEASESVTIDARMDTAGMVVLADLWDKGWHASVDGEAARILVVNHAIRGVVTPAGEHRVVFRYEPDSVQIGRVVSGVALVVTIGWLTCIVFWRRIKQESTKFN